MRHSLFIMLLSLALAGCAATGPRTELATSWQDPRYVGEGLDTIAVLANFRTESDSRQFERQVAGMLRERGIEAVEGRSFLDNGRTYSEREMEARLGDVDADGILVFKLIAVDEDLTYHPPRRYLRNVQTSLIVGEPYFWYYYPHPTYYPYWRSSLVVTQSPGYWSAYRYVVVETSLYDNATNQLIWTAKSETMEPREFSNLADSISRAVIRRLSELSLIRAGS